MIQRRYRFKGPSNFADAAIRNESGNLLAVRFWPEHDTEIRPWRLIGGGITSEYKDQVPKGESVPPKVLKMLLRDMTDIEAEVVSDPILKVHLAQFGHPDTTNEVHWVHEVPDTAPFVNRNFPDIAYGEINPVSNIAFVGEEQLEYFYGKAAVSFLFEQLKPGTEPEAPMFTQRIIPLRQPDA